jgi:hypothetical protein
LLKRPTVAEDGDYACKRFFHWLTDLDRYNIKPILIDAYDQVPVLLADLNRRSHLKDVFISGSAADFAPLGKDKFGELCGLLGSQLIKNDFNIISGYGSGVGDLIIVGAMRTLMKNDEDRLQLWPFPQQTPAGEDRAAFWRKYRERIISNAGVCIVLAGNKSESGAIVPADGVRQEVEIARAQGKAVIPVGATGHVAEELWKECSANPSLFFGRLDVGTYLNILGDPSQDPGSLVQCIIDVLKQLDK